MSPPKQIKTNWSGEKKQPWFKHQPDLRPNIAEMKLKTTLKQARKHFKEIQAMVTLYE